MDRLSVTALLVATLVGCSKPAKRHRLFTEAELATLDAKLIARLEANAKRSCKRPPLGAPVRPGSGTARLQSLVEPSAAIKGCLDAAARIDKKVGELAKKRDSRLVEIEARCGAELEAVVGDVAAHEDVCSPYQAGVRAEPTSGSASFLTSVHLLGLRVRMRADTDPVGALRLAAQSIRTFQDYSRGATNLLSPMIGSAAINAMLDHVEHVLEQHSISPDAATSLATMFDTLVKSEPSFGDSLRGELDFAALHMGLPLLRPTDWVPPGGKSEDFGPPDAGGIQPRDLAGLMLALGEESPAARACPADASLAACRKGFVLLSEKDIDPAVGDPYAHAAKLVARIDSDAARLGMQRDVLEIMVTVASPMYEDYVEKRARAYSRLIGAHIAFESKRASPCPPAVSELELFANPARLGDKVIIHIDGPTLTIEPPAWAERSNAAFVTSCR